MASLQYTKSSTIQTVTLGAGYTSGSGSMTLTAGNGAYLPSSGDFWLSYNNGSGTIRIFKVTARSTDTLTVTAVTGEGAGDGNISSGETLRWALSVDALDQLKADIKASTGLVLLKTLTASSSSSLDFATRTDGSAIIQSDFDTYKIVVTNLFPATNGAALWMRVSTDGGATYISTTSYDWSGFVSYYGGTGLNGGATQAQIVLATDQINNTAKPGFSGEYNFYDPANATSMKALSGQGFGMTSTSTPLAWTTFGYYTAATAVNAFQFKASSGNLASGYIRIYGIAKT